MLDYQIQEIRELLEKLDEKELKKVQKILDNCKKKVNSRPEFLDVIKDYVKNYSKVKYICTGYIGKGSWESEGECFSSNYYNISKEDLKIAYREKGNSGDNEHFLNQFNTLEDFLNACANTYFTYNEIKKLTKNTLHKPDWKDSDAVDLENGECDYIFIDLNTGESHWISTNAYD